MNSQRPTVLVNLAELDPPRNGGMSRVAHLVSGLLAEYYTAGHMDVYFAVGWSFAAHFQEWLGSSGLQVIPVLPDEGFSPIFDFIHPDLIISPLFGLFPFRGKENPFPGVPHFVSMPDAQALDKPELFSLTEAGQRRKTYEDLQQASLVITLSQHARQRLEHHLGLRPDQVTVIPLAGDIYRGPLPPLMPEVSPPYVFYAANGWPHKRHDLLFQIMNLVWKTRPDLQLVLSGWFPKGYLEHLVKQHEIPAGRAVYLDRISDAQMVTLYKNAEAFLFTSAYEGFGMPILEAMLAGCPVICAPLTSIPEVAGDAALYVDNEAEPQAWADALLIRLPVEREELVARGIKQAEQFSWEKARQDWQSLIEHYLKITVARTKTKNLITGQPDLLFHELQWWATHYEHLWGRTVEKEGVIGEQKAVMNKQQVIIDEQKAAVDKQQAVIAEQQAANNDLHHRLLEREQVVQAFSSSFPFWLRHGPLNRYRLFRWSISQLRRLRHFLFPRLISPKDQYSPRPVHIPSYYQADYKINPDKLPIISIVTPSYNQAKFLQQTIRSVLEQGYPKLEYAIQDGGSQDGTQEILEQYHSQLSHVESRKDGGQASAINLGFKHVSGEIMAYLNSDDLLLPGSLHYVADFFNCHPDVDVIYGHRVIINEDGDEIGRWVLPPHDSWTQLWLDFVPQETLFWRRRIWEKVGGYVDETYQFAMDWELFLRFVKAGAQIRRLPRFLGAFRSHPQQKTSSRINDLGIQEMERVRKKYLGRVVTQAEIEKAIKPYLGLSLVYHALYHVGLLRY